MPITLPPQAPLSHAQPDEHRRLIAQRANLGISHAEFERLAGVSSMLPQFGVIADGSTDDSAEIQAAVDATPVRGTLKFAPRGLYVIRSPVVLRGDITLDFNGSELFTDAAIRMFVLDGTAGSEPRRLRLMNGRFLGNSDGTLSTAIWLNNVFDALIHGCIFREFDGAATSAVILQDCLYAMVANNYFAFGTRGVELVKNTRSPGSENCTITSNNFHNLTEDGVRVDESDSVTITGNTFKTVGAQNNHCIHAITSALSATITGNNFESGPGSSVYGPFQESCITGNAMEAVGDGNASTTFNPGIHVGAGANVISGNAISRVGGHGILLDGSSNLVSGNKILGPGWGDTSSAYSGIYVAAGRDENSVVSNYFSTAAGKFAVAGIHIAGATADRTLVSDNYIVTTSGTVDAPVLDQGTGTILRNNVGFTEETATGTFTSNANIPVTRIESAAGTVTVTLGAANVVGAMKTIVMTDASNSSTVSVTNHETSDPEVITFAAVDDTAVLMWTGTEWVTIKLSGATVSGGGSGGPEFLTYLKAADTARNSSTAYVDDPDLVSDTLEANSVYRFELLLLFTADAASDMRFRVERTGLSDADLRYASDLDNSAAVALTWNSNTNCAGAGTTAYRIGNYIGVLRTGTDTGTVEVAWGQQTSGAVDTTMRAGSKMLLRKIA